MMKHLFSLSWIFFVREFVWMLTLMWSSCMLWNRVSWKFVKMCHKIISNASPCFDLWTTKLTCKYSHMEGVTQCAHMAVEPPPQLRPCWQAKGPSLWTKQSAVWCFSHVCVEGLLPWSELTRVPSFPYWTGIPTCISHCLFPFDSSSFQNTLAPSSQNYFVKSGVIPQTVLISSDLRYYFKDYSVFLSMTCDNSHYRESFHTH